MCNLCVVQLPVRFLICDSEVVTLIVNEWTVKDNTGDTTTIVVTTKKVAVSQDNSGEGTAMYYNLERLDYLIASLQEARELYKNVRRINK